MENDLNNKIYFYDSSFYSFDELCKLYENILFDKKKLFKDTLAHFSLCEIFKKCDYDEKYINCLEALCKIEVDRIQNNYTGRSLTIYNKEYISKFRKLFNLIGKFNETKMNVFINGEWLLNYVVSLTLGSSYEKDINKDLYLIKYDTLSDDECQAIANNFIRYIKDEDIIFYESPKKLKK